MNKTRRAMISRASKSVHEAFDYIDSAYEQESECLSNFPENLSSSEKYEKLEEYTDLLEEARDQLEYACNAVDQILTS